MKITSTVTAFLLCLSITDALRFERSEPAPAAGPAPSSANSKFQALDSIAPTNWDEITVPGYDDDRLVEPPVQEFIPSYHWVGTKDIQSRELMERQGFCLYLAQCAGLLKDYAAYYAVQGWGGLTNWCSNAAFSVHEYFTGNNYQHATAILDGALSNFFLAIPVGIATYYVTGRIAKIEGGAPTNTCGARQPAVIAEQSASGFYQFCVSIRDHGITATTTRYTSGDMSTNHPVFDDSDGLLLIKKFYVGSNKFDIAAVCRDYGIVWRRDFVAALNRGENRSIKKSRSLE